MSAEPNSFHDDSLDLARQIDALCDAFESLCLAGEHPQIEAFLDRVDAKQQLLVELIAIEVHYRRSRSDSPTLTEYQARFPGLSLTRLESSFESSIEVRLPLLPKTLAIHQPTLDSQERQQASEGIMVRYFGDYELLEVIARGGMGVVYKARQISLNRIVALKMILSGEFASQREIDRFYSEAKAAALLDHPDIVPIYEVGEHEGKHFFSMTYVEGKSLADQLSENPLDPRAAAKLMLSVSQAVQYAHEHGVIHRDLKPSNILLDLRGRPRVTDFGLAKRLADDSGLTVSGDVLGTPSYMPPEQASGQIDTVGPISDVYSLGAILYSVITGRPPFQAASGIDTMRQVVEQEPVSPRQLNPSIPRDLETIVLKCLEKSIARRYHSAQQLADELQRFIEGRPIVARPIGRVAKAWRWCRRNPMPASMFSAVAMTMFVATIVSTSYARKEGLANKALDREHKDGLSQLAKSFASEANALRMSGRPGQRFGALRAIRESMKITGPTRELADVAAAALCLPDCEVDFEWEGFPEGTRRVTLSPTFDRYARVSDAGVISIRSLPDDEEISNIKVDGVYRDYGALRFSQDGRFLFEVYDAPRRARVWLIADEQPRLIADENSSWVETLDGRHVLIAKGSQLLIVDATGEKPNRSIPIGEDISEYFFGGQFGQSKILLSFGRSWKTVDTHSGEISSAFSQPSQLACWPAPHANGQWAVWSTSSPPTGFLVDIQTGRQLAPPFGGHKAQGVVPFISRNGEVAFSNDWHGIMRMWDTRSGRSLFSRPSADINTWQVVSNDNQLVGPETAGNQVRWLRFASGHEFGQVAASTEPNDLIFYSEASVLSPDGRLFAFGAKSGLVLCDTLSGLPLLRIAERKFDEDHVLGFLDDGSLLTNESYRIVRRNLTRGSDGTLQVGTPNPQAAVPTPKGILVRTSSSRDGAVLGIPKGKAGAICVRAHQQPVELELATTSDIRCVSVSPDGKYIAAGVHGADEGKTSRCAYVWETASGRLVTELETRSLCYVAFSPSGRYLTVASGEVNECRVFEVEAWRLVDSFSSKYPGVFSPDENLFAIATNPGEVSLRRASDMTEFAKLSSPNENAYRPLAFTPDNSRLYACNMETEQMCVWSLALIRKGLEDLALAKDWPKISLESTPEIAPPSLKTIVDAPTSVPGKPQPPPAPSGVELVDQVRKTGWSIVLALLPKLEAAEQERFPGIRQFADDVRRLEKSIDTSKSPHEWNTIDVGALLHRNPHFWNALYEIAPGDFTHTVIHIGLLSACGELEQAHNLIHLAMLDSELVQEYLEYLKPLDRSLHLMLTDSGTLVKQGMTHHDAKEFDKAIDAFTVALKIWPQNAAAHYELGYTKSTLKDEAAQQHFASSRRYDPLRREAIPVALLPMLIPACRHAAQAKSLWNSFLNTKAGVADSELLELSENCQLAAPIELRFHELALVVRQLVVATKGRYDDQDKLFIATSLRQLIPAADVEQALQRLNGDASALFTVTVTQVPSVTE